MVYFNNGTILIRDMTPEDAQSFCEEELLQGWGSTLEKHRLRLHDREQGRAIPLAAEYRGLPAGYISIYLNAQEGAFGGQGLPELVDFAVLEKYRNHGIGGILMDAAEKIAAEYADTVYLGVGLHAGYGSAQKMYVKRGYIPDGSGLWYKDRQATPYETYRNDDDMVLYMSKKLK